MHHDVRPVIARVQRLAIRLVAKRPGDAEGGMVVVPRRRDRRLCLQRAKGERQYRAPHLLAVTAASGPGDQEGRCVDRPQQREVVAFEFLEAHDLAGRRYDKAEPPG